MAMIWEWICESCGCEWDQFSTKLYLGLDRRPNNQACKRLICYSCLTFLSCPIRVDRNSWLPWKEKNGKLFDQFPALKSLAEEIDAKVNDVGKYTPVEISFSGLICPNCKDETLCDSHTFDGKMKCPSCSEYTGVNRNPGVISSGYIVRDERP